MLRGMSEGVLETVAETGDRNEETPAARSSRWVGFAVFLGFLAVTIGLYALPVLTRLGSVCVGRCVPDTSIYAWSMRWMPYAIGAGADPLYSEIVWAPVGTNLAWVTSLPGPAFVMSPVTQLFGPIVSVNVLMVLAPTLAAWAAFLLLREVTERIWPSIVGAAVFGYSTYIGQHMRSHLNLLLVFFVPLAAYLVVRRVRGRIGPIAFVALLTLTLVGQFSVSSELFATMTLFGAIAVAGAVAFAGSELRPAIVRTLPLIMLAYALTALAVSPFLVKALGDAPTGSIRPLELNSVDLLSFVLPRKPMLVGGDRFASVTADFPGKPWDDTGYLGIGLLVVAASFAWTRRRERSTWLVLGFAAVAAVLALGPALHVDGEQVTTLMPGRAIASLPLIQHALPERFPMYLFLALAVITALWLAGATDRRSQAVRYGAVAAAVVLMLPQQVGQFRASELVVPAFFREGTYRGYIEDGENVLAIPRKLGGDLVWQAEADMAFRLARTYLGPVRPTGLPGLGPILSSGARGLPSRSALRRFLETRDVGVVVVEEPADERVVALLDDVLGSTGVSVDGVLVYPVPSELPE
jgi:hypothetical protein